MNDRFQAVLLLAALLAATPAAAFDWEAAPWGIVIATNGTPGSPATVLPSSPLLLYRVQEIQPP